MAGARRGNTPERLHTKRHVEDKDEHADNGPRLPRLGLQFVAETGVARPRGALREIIRSQARRKRSSITNGRDISRSSHTSPELHTSNHADRETDSSSADSRTLGHLLRTDGVPRPSSEPAAKAFDPFQTLPIEERGDFHFLFKQFQLICNPQYHAFSCAIPKEDIINFAITDPALMHALAHSALSISNIGKGASSNVAYHGGQAIRLVNKRIANSPHEAVSDATMFAVGCLTQVEVRSRSARSIKIHLDGLEALVKSRGGIHALVDHPVTMKFVYWTDAIGSIALNTKPRFHLAALPPQLDPSDWEAHSYLAQRYATKLCNLTGLTDLSQETIEVYWGLHNLTVLNDLMFASHKTTITRMDYNGYVGRVVVRLVNMVQYDIPDSPNTNALIFKLFGNAALTHVVLFMRVAPMHHSFSELLSARMRKSLEMVDVPAFQLQYPEMMLWILLMGGMGSIGTDNQWWYAKLVADACLAQGIARTSEIMFFLSEFLWTDLYLFPFCTEFWEDVAMAIQGGHSPMRVIDVSRSVSPLSISV